MANFTNNRYPWPTQDHGGANAETGGNTRLLFAEQDNYRTPKGFADDGTPAVTTVHSTAAVLVSTDLTTGATNYLGTYATDALASNAATGPAQWDFYYNTEDNQFRYWDHDATPAAWAIATDTDDREFRIAGTSDTIGFFKSSSTHGYTNAEDAANDIANDAARNQHLNDFGGDVVYLIEEAKAVEISAVYAEVPAAITTTDLTEVTSAYLGAHANDAAANTAASGTTGADDDFYYDTTANQFKYWTSGDAWAVITANTQIPGDVRLITASLSTHEFANLNRLTKAVHDGHIADARYLTMTTNAYAYLADSNKAVNIDHYNVGTSVVPAVSGSGANDVFYVIPRVVSADIAETTENIPIEFLKGSLSANKAQAGAQTYGNGFSIAASEQGMHLFLRTLCNSRNNDIIVKTRNNDSTATPKRDTLPDSSVHVDGGDVADVSDRPVEFTSDVVSPKVAQLSITPADIYTGNVLELQIDGYDHEGEELREIMLLTADNNDDDKLTDFYFSQPPEGKKTTYQVNRAGGTGATINITSLDHWTEVTFNQQDSVLLPGWTVEVRKGTIPFTYVGVSPNEASIALSRDTALQMDITTIAFDSLPYTDIEGGRVDLDDGSGSEGIDIDNQKGRGEIDFVDASETLFTGWQAYLDVTEPGTATPVRVPLTDATFSINHQLDQAQLIVGDRRPGPPFRSTLRDVMLDGTILFTRERDWVRLFRNNTDFKNPRVVLRNASAGGFPYELHIELGLGQLMSSPDPQVSDLGLITQAFNMKFRETKSGMSDDFRFKIVTDKWVFETENNTVGGLRVDGIYAASTA